MIAKHVEEMRYDPKIHCHCEFKPCDNCGRPRETPCVNETNDFKIEVHTSWVEGDENARHICAIFEEEIGYELTFEFADDIYTFFSNANLSEIVELCIRPDVWLLSKVFAIKGIE